MNIWEIIGIIGYIAVYYAAFQSNVLRLRVLVVLATILFSLQDIYFGFWSNLVLGFGYIGIHLYRVKFPEGRPNARKDAELASKENI